MASPTSPVTASAPGEAAAPPPSSREPGPGGRAVDAGIATRLTWLLVFRSLVMGALLVVSVLANITEPAMLSEPPQVIVYGAVAAAFGVMLAGALWQRRAPLRWLGGQVALQIGGDLAVATTLIFATGGTESAFVFLYSLSVINAAALAYRPGALLTAAGASACYLALVLAQRAGLGAELIGLHPLPLREVLRVLLFNASALFLVALLAAYVSEQLRQTGASLQEARVDLTRLASLHGAVLSSLTSGLMALDAEGRVTLVNRAGEALLCTPGGAARGRPVEELLPGLASHLNRAAGTRFELQLPGAAGARVLGCSVAPLSGDAGGHRGHVVTFQDLTEIRALEEAIQRSERLATVGQFAAGLAHELRNPLGSLTGCVELLRQDTAARETTLDEEARARLFDIVLREAERLNRLLTDFLHYARPASTDKRPLRLAAVLEETSLVARREMAGERAVQIEVAVEDPELIVDGDLGQLKQVLWNLLLNAAQAAGPQGRVRLSARRAAGTPGTVAVEVEDSGPGIPVELRARVFDPFFTTKEQGTGLGLPTVLRIVEQHGASIAIDDSSLGGARVQVLFPAPDPANLAASQAS